MKTGEHIEYRTSNGHTVLMDRQDWLALRPLLKAGIRLQSRMHVRESLRVLLREYGRQDEPQRTMLLSKMLLAASAHQVVAMLNGPLDHRRRFIVLEDARREQGWSSRIHAAQRVQTDQALSDLLPINTKPSRSTNR